MSSTMTIAKNLKMLPVPIQLTIHRAGERVSLAYLATASCQSWSPLRSPCAATCCLRAARPTVAQVELPKVKGLNPTASIFVPK